MSFNSLHNVLETIEKQPSWKIQQEHRHLVKCWQSVIEPKIALHTRPLYMARKIFWVATSSSVWAQTLSLKRHTLLKKLNALLPYKLIDIRFSSAHWHQQNQSQRDSSNTQATQRKDPSKMENNEVIISSLSSLDDDNSNPKAAFERWAKVIKKRSQQLPPCPHCQCPTPLSELQRWNLCSHCVAKQWQ